MQQHRGADADRVAVHDGNQRAHAHSTRRSSDGPEIGRPISRLCLWRISHMFVRFVAEHYRPPSRPNHVYVINYKTSTGSWEPLFNAKGKPLHLVLMAELDAIKALLPTGGLMLRRDGSSLPWFGKGEMLTQVQRISKKVIIAATRQVPGCARVNDSLSAIHWFVQNLPWDYGNLLTIARDPYCSCERASSDTSESRE
jgi:hypothetical protein